LVTPRKSVPEPAPGDPQIGPVRRFGNYTLIKKLATGGMAEIWLARQRGLAGFQRFIVIKKILSHLSDQKTFRDMFLDEARTSAQLNHPNVVQIYDLGNEQGAYYIAMEFIAGENLAAIAWRGMKRGKPFPPAFAARVIADACKALHYAHHLKGPSGQPLEIVHRDISPQNILVTYEGEVKVVDFGIAKAATKSEHTKTGMLKGKFSYMSPEQCLGAPVDMRSDVFALGILLYELCTGKRLFKHESELMILDMITKRSVVPPSSVAPGITPRLEDIILRALEKETQVRFQTAQDMQIALEEYLRSEGHQATNADIAAYMRELFADKIEEKRRLREIASAEDFEAQFGDDEATEQAMQNRRRVVHGLPPSQVRAQGTTPGALAPPQIVAGQLHPMQATGSMPHMAAYPSQPGVPYPFPPGTTPPGFPPGYTQGSAQFPPGYAQASYAGQIQQDAGGGWVARVVIIGALIVIVVASLILYKQLNHEVTPVQQVVGPATPAVPRKTGSLTLKSVPQGAVIYLDGKPMTLADGTNAKTPSDLHSLQYGTEYAIKLVKPGYRPFETKVVMGEQTDNQTIRPDLTAFPGWLIAEVQGEGKDEVQILFNNEEVGQGPMVKKEVEGNTDVVVKGKLAGKVCTANPPRVRVEPNVTLTTTLKCTTAVAVRAPPPPPPTTTNPGGGTTNTVTRVRPPKGDPVVGSGDCVTDPSLPPGYVTISTKPYATLFWNGRKLGETPVSKVRLPSGCVTLNAKTKSGADHTFQVKVEPNKVNIYKHNLE
jgi:tRNA A-37 threonylcarbamoyl transferase component Bud32